MVGIAVPVQLLPLESGDLPKSLTGLKPDLRCQGFFAEGTGTVTVTMQAPGESAATEHELPCGVKNEWLGEFKSVTAFDTVTKIWVYLTDVHS